MDVANLEDLLQSPTLQGREELHLAFHSQKHLFHCWLRLRLLSRSRPVSNTINSKIVFRHIQSRFTCSFFGRPPIGTTIGLAANAALIALFISESKVVGGRPLFFKGRDNPFLACLMLSSSLGSLPESESSRSSSLSLSSSSSFRRWKNFVLFGTLPDRVVSYVIIVNQ